MKRRYLITEKGKKPRIAADPGSTVNGKVTDKVRMDQPNPRGTREPEGIKLDVGCSYHKLPGYVGVDIESGADVDIIADLHKLPFATSSVDRIHTRHTLEHVTDPHRCIAEMYRVCRAGGRITIIVPHYSNHAYWADMTHLRPFSIRSFEYFDLSYAQAAGFPVYLPEVNLHTVERKLVYWPQRVYKEKAGWKRAALSLADAVISYLANKSQFLCERLWCYWVGGFYEVRFELEPVKNGE